MSHDIKGVGALDSELDGSSLRIGIVYARWNSVVIDALVDGAVKELLKHGVRNENIIKQSVPGSYELPFGTKTLWLNGQHKDKHVDAIIAVGTLIKGETMHFEYISDAVSSGLMKLPEDIHIPVIFGVLTCLSEKQALARAGLTPDGHNHGQDWGAAAVEMAIKLKQAGGSNFLASTLKNTK